MAPRRRFDFRFKEKVLQYAELHSGERAARHFDIDSKRIRYWRKQRGQLLAADRRRARLAGGGRKRLNLQLEKKLSDWIYSTWHKRTPVTGTMILDKVSEVSNAAEASVASRSWLQRFLQRNTLSLQRRAEARTDPHLLTRTLVSFVDYVGRTVRAKGISEEDIIAMDETAVWLGSHLTVVLAAKADGTKLKPFVVFRGAAELKELQQLTSSAVIGLSDNGWMNDALTADWLQSAVGHLSPGPCLLVWDSYRCHVSAATSAELSRRSVTAAVIPSGCAKYAQPCAVCWKQPLNKSLQDVYDQWTSGQADEEAPSHRLLVDWVVSAWDKLDEDLIRKSFKLCGLSVRADGSEDDLILCLREGQACAAGREALSGVRRQAGRPQEAWDEDDEELLNNEVVVFDDEEDDVGEEDSDHMSWHCFIHQALPFNNNTRLLIKEEQQEWSSSLDQEEPEPPHIKEEQEELWTNQEEDDITMFTFNPVPVKSEDDDDEEKPQSSQMETEADGEDCGGPEPARTSDPDPETDDSDDSDFWKETREDLAGLTSPKMNRNPVSDVGRKAFVCSECEKRFDCLGSLKIHSRVHSGEEPFSCSVCQKSFRYKGNYVRHVRSHTMEKSFSCSVCGKRFYEEVNVKVHTRIHREDEPFSCTQEAALTTHGSVHTAQDRSTEDQQTENREAERGASSSPRQTDTEGPEPEPDPHLQPDTEDSSDADTDDSDDWNHGPDPRSGLNTEAVFMWRQRLCQ